MLKYFASTLLLIFHLSYHAATSVPITNCPPKCQCFSSMTVMCSEESLRLMPANMSTQVKELIVMTTGLMHLSSTTMRYSPHLTKLIFVNNMLQHVSTMAFDHLTGLEELEISGNHLLEHLNPGTFHNQRNLTRLMLNFNKFKSLSNGIFSSLQKLRTLQLKGNLISHLPGQIFQNLPSLRVLDLSLNRISKVDGELLRGLSQLETLRLGYNRIDVLLPDTFHNISKVKSICLRGNQISHLPRGVFTHLRELEELKLRSNLIANVSSGIFPSSLQVLDLKDNRVAQLSSDSFYSLTSLSHLSLSKNQLTDLPEAVFQNLTSLQHLDLSENKLTLLPGKIFQGLTALEFVHLQNNNLSSLEATLFADQVFLEQLYLSDNSLQILPQGFFDTSVHENMMRLRRNPWRCDCHLLYLYDYVVEHRHLVVDLSNVYCNSPMSLRGQSLVSIERDQLVCPSNISSRASAAPFNCSVEERPNPGQCTVQVIEDNMIIKCKVTKGLPLSLKVQFQEGDSYTSEYVLKKDSPQSESSQCYNLSINTTV